MPTIKLFANLRDAAGKKEVSVTGGSLGAVVSELAKRHPALAGMLLEDGRTRRGIILALNGDPTTDLDAPVTEADEIAIFPPIAGG